MELQQLNLFTVTQEVSQQGKNEVVFANDMIKVTLKTKKNEIPAGQKEPDKTIQKRGRKSTKETYTNIELIDVPEDAILNQKLYYSISEVAKWFNVNPSQIRFWENEFDILQPRKNRKGDRLFRVEDIKNLQLIYYLLRNRKFSIEGAKDYLKANKNKVKLNFKLVESLTKFRSFLLELKANLES
jgi:DNA-binding transcriptional MerR regulator